MSVYVKCSKHPDYQAYQYPRSGCPACVLLWLLLHDTVAEEKHTAHLKFA